jgi:hypothetical protein
VSRRSSLVVRRSQKLHLRGFSLLLFRFCFDLLFGSVRFVGEGQRGVALADVSWSWLHTQLLLHPVDFADVPPGSRSNFISNRGEVNTAAAIPGRPRIFALWQDVTAADLAESWEASADGQVGEVQVVKVDFAVAGLFEIGVLQTHSHFYWLRVRESNRVVTNAPARIPAMITTTATCAGVSQVLWPSEGKTSGWGAAGIVV